MSHPSGTLLISSLVTDGSLPANIRIAAIRNCRAQRPLLRVIRDSETSPTLRALAILRYDKLARGRQSIREIKQEQTGSKLGSTSPQRAAGDQAI